MVVDLGKTEIFEGHVAHAHHGRVDVHGTVADLLEQRTELLLVHEARISECGLQSVMGDFAVKVPVDCATV
jgi:hypothetical protein